MDEETARLGLAIRQAGITNPQILNAFSAIARRDFLVEKTINTEHDNAALGLGQVASTPFILATMIDYLDVDGDDKVLEIGTGSGYQTALLAMIVQRIFSLEIIRPFYLAAQKRFKALGLSNIVAMSGDGLKGWPAQKPFDRIIVNGACQTIAPIWLNHLKPDGFILMPLVDGNKQHLVRVFHIDKKPYIETINEINFPSLIMNESI